MKYTLIYFLASIPVVILVSAFYLSKDSLSFIDVLIGTLVYVAFGIFMSTTVKRKVKKQSNH